MAISFATLILLLAATCAALVAADVTVLSGYQLLNWQLKVEVQVQRTGIGSAVTVVYCDRNGTWSDKYAAAAHYMGASPNGADLEFWVTDQYIDPKIGISSFYVRYDGADGVTYYGNNGGKNYRLEAPAASPTAPSPTIAPTATSPVIVMPSWSCDGHLLYGVNIQVQRFGPAARGAGSKVSLFYSDHMGNWHDPPLKIDAVWMAPVYGSPDQDAWLVDHKPLVDDGLGISRFYIKYDGADGNTYYANNNGRNYFVYPTYPPIPVPETIFDPPQPTLVLPSRSRTRRARHSSIPALGKKWAVQCEPITPAWSPNVDLIDTSNSYIDGKPADGWFVTPIHATLLSDGQLYVVGWGRRDYEFCVAPEGTRKHSVSFVIATSDIVSAGAQPTAQAGRNPTLTIPTPIPDLRRSSEDALYCSGQVTLPDGRIFVVGGASYQNLGLSNEIEQGLSYGRIFDPTTTTYTVTPDAPIGSMWYPTAAQLPSGDILVTGGFVKCCQGDPDANDNVAIYHPASNTWTALGSIGDHLITPGLRDYTHVWVLPQPVVVNAIPRQVAMMGYKGVVVYFSTDPSVPDSQRAVTAPNGDRSVQGGSSEAWDSTAFSSPTGELVSVGGGSQPWKLDAFNASSNTWRSLDASFSRDNGASVLLPDGSVLLLNGHNRFDEDQIPPPQLFDPFTNTFTTLPEWTDDVQYRAYHSWAILLKDGRVAVGGGVDGGSHTIACERVDVRIFTPPYLRKEGASCITRPKIEGDAAAIVFTANRAQASNSSTTTISFSNANVRSARGAALMALGSFTHAFDQNQRYVPLSVDSITQPQGGAVGSLALRLPSGHIIFEGLYNLFLIGEDGTPSVGVTARVVADQ
ncbi:hypothetical protein HDU87_003563 [Geranomyces variabilis]|uniref:Galactose oxidase-like Early set domain-containing protein n=1 Tax=Geranomyces variabilis TaxID=109894 RepID=A0AAD5XQF6_9FUNG|nr:hypothetical protein HDU87_003563 [Geranomyces variabilis]